ncbi:MAG: YgaP family membrane protein [Thermoanaerobaculia bacterium]
MHLEQSLRLIAGIFILLSVALGWLVSPWFYLFTAFVGLNLLQSAFTNWCPMMGFLRMAGVRECGVRPEVRDVA